MVPDDRPFSRLYLDNAATSFPKPREVAESMAAYARELGASPGRGAYREVAETTRILERCRERLARLLGCPSREHVIFTLNTTDALSMAIHGIVSNALARHRRVHLLTTDLDHNSVLRPFRLLAERHPDSVSTTRVPCDPRTGRVDPAEFAAHLRPETVLAAVAHGSNATGTLQPIKALAARCNEAGVPLLVDAAQTAGHRPLDMTASGIDMLAVPGHKGLLGPLGTGALLMRPGMEERIDPIRVGGTGSVSESDRHPDTMPERYEAGSHNAIGLVGLEAALGWLENRTIKAVADHERPLIERLLEGLLGNPDLRLLGPAEPELRCGVFSFVHRRLEATEVANRLEHEHGILARSGLHCAPHAHRTFGTDPDTAERAGREAGACRISLGPFVDAVDVERTLDALGAIDGSRTPTMTRDAGVQHA